MKEFRCGDVVPACTATFREPSESAMLEAVALHARRDHGLESVPDALTAQVRAAIR